MKSLWKRGLLCFGLLFVLSVVSPAQERKISSKVAPVYPDTMRKLHMGGTVKVQVVISADGHVREAKALGGHPMFIGPATDAIRQWKFEPASEQTTTVIEFKFDPNQQ